MGKFLKDQRRRHRHIAEPIVDDEDSSDVCCRMGEKCNEVTRAEGKSKGTTFFSCASSCSTTEKSVQE
jgi:hypothetical protein